MYTEYCVLSKAHEDAGNKDFKLFPYNIRSSQYSFLNLLDIDMKKGFERNIFMPQVVLTVSTIFNPTVSLQ